MLAFALLICIPFGGSNPLKCECAYPIIKDGHLDCGPTYCPADTTCMPLWNCCKTEKVCGLQSAECCKDDETCINKIACCPSDTPYLDSNSICVECTNDTHCAGDKICDTSNGTCIIKETEGCSSDADCNGVTCNLTTKKCCENIAGTQNGGYYEEDKRCRYVVLANQCVGRGVSMTSGADESFYSQCCQTYGLTYHHHSGQLGFCDLIE